MFSIGEDSDYFESEAENREILTKVAQKCYLPANELLLKLIQEDSGLKVTFSLSGVVLDQFQKYAPEVLESFRALVDTGKVELLGETYYHSLAFMYSGREFERQVSRHRERINELFGYAPKAFRNTELIYNNDLAKVVEELGFETVLAEGVDRYLVWRSPNFVYQPKSTDRLKLMLKNYRLSDDIAFRFSNRDWDGWPLTADKFASWMADVGREAQVINLFMDYETIGEHHWAETGIFQFLEGLPAAIGEKEGMDFATVSEAAARYEPAGVVEVPEFTSWADSERDVSAWLSNPLQQSAVEAVFELEEKVVGSGNAQLIDDWGRMTSSDHFYYMSTKTDADGEVHEYFSPYNSPYDAFVDYMNVLHDLRQRV